MMERYRLYKKEYEENGFTLIKNFLNHDEVKELKKIVDSEIEKAIKEKDSRSSHKVGDQVNSIHKINNDARIHDFQTRNDFTELIEYLMEEESVPFGAEIFAKPAMIGLAVPPHQDNYYWCVEPPLGMTVWIALQQSGKENGGVYYLKKSHKNRLIAHENSGVPGSSKKIIISDELETFEKIIPELMPGDILIHNVLVIHGSDKNNSSKGRCGLTFRYISKEHRIDSAAKNQYEIDLNEQLRSRGEI